MGVDREVRRTVLRGGLALGLSLTVLKAGTAADDPKKQRPQPGDVLVFAKGDRKDQPISSDDVALNGPVLGAYPMDTESGVVRRGSKLNRVILIRLAPDSYGDKTQEHTTDGVAAYSGFCTHQGCSIKDCVCHNSKFDPRDRGRAVFGPAKRRLAMLPIKQGEGTLVVAASFVGKLGVAKS